jgi:hypothetical protein
MQPLMERNERLSHLLRTLRGSCHIAQGLAFNGSDVFWAGTSGLYPAWASTYDSELGSFNCQMRSGLSINLTPARLVLFHHASCLPLRRLRLSSLLRSILCFQSDLSLWRLAFQSLLTYFHWPFILCFFGPNSPLQTSRSPFLSYPASSPGAVARLFRCLTTRPSLAYIS